MTAPPARNDVGGSGNPSRATAKTAFTALYDYVVERLGGTAATATTGEQNTACTALGAVRLTGDTMTGNLNVPSINGGQIAGHLNKIINGAFGINQRTYVSAAATTAGQYTFDRWKVTGTGGISFSTTANKTTVTIPGGQTIQQVIEGLNLQTGTYVLSWEGTAQGRINAGSYGASGTVTASITGGVDTTIEFNAGTVTNVQFQPGTVATPFEKRLYGPELDLCRRYGRPWGGAKGIWTTTTLCRLAEQLDTPMRATPTAVLLTTAPVVEDWAIAPYTGSGSAIVANFSSVSHADLTINGFTGAPGGRAPAFAAANIVFLSAEL